jgi:hypothetical protein
LKKWLVRRENTIDLEFLTSHEVTRNLKYPVEGYCMQPKGEKGDKWAGENEE